ncbi:MAG: ATPase, T2SS/T4P/T4SS family [Myxococcota bacterium]|nr:ATPase, T2SS/T4P/T4SS family [Myxococcota bacterium]
MTRFDPRDLPQTYPPEPEWRERIYGELSRCVDQELGRQGGIDKNALLDQVANEAVALGPLEFYLDDESVTEIHVNRHDCIVVERDGQLLAGEYGYTSVDFLYLTAQRLLSMIGHTPATAPLHSEVRFGDGTLVQVVLPPVAVGSPLIVVRKPRRQYLPLEDFASKGLCSPNMLSFLETCLDARRSILIAGPNGSGRSSLLNALAAKIPEGARIVSVEATAMLQLPQRTAVCLETQPATPYGPAIDLESLMNTALRLRPERVLLDPIRGPEANLFMQATAAGAAGSIAVIGALGAQDALRRLEQLALSSTQGFSGRAIYDQLARAIDVVVVMHRFADGSRRIVEIAEVCGATSSHVDIETLFTYETQGMGDAGASPGQFLASGYIPRFYRELESGGVRLNSDIFRD